MINRMEDTSDNTVKKIVKIVPNGDRFSIELSDRSALIGIFHDENDARVAARLMGYEVV